ncbi:alpha-D-kanosaminyltransferase [mine drainage metagenome]|uniref:Alpha-D-kanosaminyltransferase n=1 Tax=mine drainage metagenome TaxID=410659 RepID=A0A1J5T4F4_9ZZZZ
MNILALHSSSDLYGSSKVFLEAIQTFLEEGNNVTAVLSEEGALSEELCKSGADVEIIRLGIIRRKYFSFFGILNRLYYLSKSFFALKKIIRSKQTDLVYSNTTAVLIGAFAAKATHKKHIWHIHEIIERPLFLHRFIAWMISKYCCKVIAVSNAVKEHWQQKDTNEKIIVLYNGFDYSVFYQDQSTLRQELKIEDDCIVIGTVGRISEWKGQDYFLRIAGEIKRKIYNVKFIIAGDVFPGNEYLIDSFNKIIEEEKIEDKVFLLGFRNDVNNVLHGMDIFVLPSVLPDPLPTVVLEAMAAGKPVVATFQGGSLEMVEENQTGIFIPVNDWQKAANLMEELISNSTIRKQMGAAGRKRVEEKFSQERFKKELIKIFA